HVVGPVPQIVHPEADQATVQRPTQQRRTQRLQVLGEDGHHVDPHGQNNPSGGSTTTLPWRRSTVGTMARTNGTSTSRPSKSTASSSPPGVCTTSFTVPRGVPSASSTASPL